MRISDWSSDVCSSDLDAQDAVQESLIRMIRYRDSEPPEAWKRLLYRIGVNVANDQHRYARSHHAAGHVTVDDALGATSTDEPTHHEHPAQQEELAAVSSEERRLGTAWVSTGRSRWWPDHSKKKHHK